MQIISMEADFNAAKVIKALTASQYAELRERFRDTNLPLEQADVNDWQSFKWVGTIDDVAWLADLNIKVTIHRVRGTFVDSSALPELGVPKHDGMQIVNVVIPNAGLFAVRKLMVIENDCTNTVQSYLNEGWRIVAVCPPNDTRRPTFILGHMEDKA